MLVSKFLDSIGAFFANPVILSCLVSWFLSQFIKGVLALIRARKKGFQEMLATMFWRTGGMPSSHAAVVSSMATSVALHEGIGSNLFAVSLFVAMVVIRDAMGVRRASGLQASALNVLGRLIVDKLGVDFQPVEEIKGHAPSEVLAGAFLGILVSALYTWV